MREDRLPRKRLECIRGLLIYVARTYKWMIPYLKGLHMKIDRWKERRKKYLYKTNSQPQVRLKVWEWGNENWLEEKELEALSIHKYEAVPELLDPPTRLREDIVALKRLTAPHNPEITRCRASESMTAFYLLGYASGQGFGLGLCNNEGLRYDSENWYTK